jgi:hypothetical protein
LLFLIRRAKYKNNRFTITLVTMIKVLIAFAVTVNCIVAGAQQLLVSPEEMKASNDAALFQFSAKATAVKDAPSIVVLAPTLTGKVNSPATIELKFQATAPSAVKIESFKAFYGTFGIDITERLLAVANVSASGIKVQEAALPKGDHKILLTVEDTDGRRGSRTIEFEVN